MNGLCVITCGVWRRGNKVNLRRKEGDFEVRRHEGGCLRHLKQELKDCGKGRRLIALPGRKRGRQTKRSTY